MAVLGVREHHFLDLPDGNLTDVDTAAPVDRLAGLIAEVAPDTILTFRPDGITYHPDHQAVSRWMDQPGSVPAGAIAAQRYERGHLKEWAQHYEDWQVFMTDERPPGVPPELVAFDLVCEGAALDRKTAALAAMHTQTAGAMELLGADVYRRLIAEECFVEAP
jgi:LmbE family N-acetylglucosaminyl deacetylase